MEVRYDLVRERYVKARDNSGVVNPILCDEPMQVFDNLKDQRFKGLEA